jgi:predicted O-methyltransferase YrrM
MGNIRRILRKIPGISRLDAFFRERYSGCRGSYIAGHFHSPIPNLAEIRTRADSLFRIEMAPTGDLALREEDQFRLLESLLPFYGGFPWSEPPQDRRRFHMNQRAFRAGDAIVLHGLMRLLKPKRIIEIGSGFSSALILDTNEHYLDNSTRLTFIDPYPGRLKALLRDSDMATTDIVARPVQEIPVELFGELGAGDFLFVDSSHVSKVGSDVNRILFDVVPVLQPGVVLHFHDIFWPFEYPQDWIFGGKFWNEAYLLRAFLQYNTRFEVLLFNSFLAHAHQSFLQEQMPEFLSGPSGSIWLQKHLSSP